MRTTSLLNCQRLLNPSGIITLQVWMSIAEEMWLEESDLRTGKWHGEISTSLGYALAMTQSQAIVWRYAQGTMTAEQLKPLSIKLQHPSNNSRHPLPLGILVPTSAEPALLVVMPISGKITYWESLTGAASVDSNRQRQQSVQGTVSGMLSGEFITNITEAEPRAFVLTLSTGRLAHLIVSDLQGKPSVNVQYLRDNGAQSGGVFGSLRGVFSSAGWRKDIAAVRAGNSWQRGQRYVIVATSKGSFQTWDLSWNGTHSLVNDVDAKDDLLHALIEGADVFHDNKEHVFEVLDCTILPSGSSGNEVAKMRKSGDCKLLTLTVLKGAESSRYALIGLTLAAGSVTIDVVHPITCYTTSLPVETQFKPQVLVPEPAQTAFLMFEKSIVLVSLVEIEETPSSQLQMEARTLADPFQDALDFRSTKPYRIVGCASEMYDRIHAQSSCVLMIYGFGFVRISALPMREGQSALDRATVTAKTKLEQAVFFGNLSQDLLDFSPRSEISFSQEEVEAAALSVSHSIMSSTSVYMPSISPSMDQQLQRRSTALADMNKHLRQYYPPLSRLTRWKLLWNAEKMAAAKALWRCYNAIISNQNRSSNDRSVLAELIESLHESLKTENQPEHHETDGVRHWFIHDVWRLEYIIPWAQNMVELMFENAVEDNKRIEPAIQARLVSEANDIQLSSLETAFGFREANMAAYGLDDEAMIDGVLLRGYEDLPEIWTSTANIVERVKTMTDVSRELACLGEDDDANEGDPLPDLVLKLAADNPRQVQICCQTYIERFRWLQSRPEPESRAAGEKLKQAHFAVRKALFKSLPDVGQPEKGIYLAEKYRDMDALADIIEGEMLSVESDETVRLLEERIYSYFVKFGTKWSNAFFKKHLDGGKAVGILNGNANFKKYLTQFFRHQPSYAKLGWIHEVASEQSYAAAAEGLMLAQKQETNLWSRKVSLSMSKLSLLAATGKGQVKDKSAKDATQTIDKDLAVVAVQEKLCNYVKPTIRNALDADAEVDLALQKYGSNVQGKSTLRHSLEGHFRKMLALEALPPEALIDTLTLLGGEGASPDNEGFMGSRFFYAFKVMRLASAETSDPGFKELQEKFIWRRCMIQDDWKAINRTELKDDAQAEVETSATALFKTLREGFRTGFWDKAVPLPPAKVLEAGISIEALRVSSHFANIPENSLAVLAQDLGKEDELLEKYMEEGRLDERWKGVVEAAKASARDEADSKGEEQLRIRNVQEEFTARMIEKDREAYPKAGSREDDTTIDDQGDVIMGM
ncbi:hypothetical protein HO173_011440 [Letharia columbiana]|uniref:Uncharacterized protein n=1 Tax=Letharia columbiana TaxID=112416 RepID=A0A8H6FJA7_9LECA|nr:uncharacterized protein HO173_011440 [Letharia columbiana]KAF6229585.1 hypothetical protein HO173_011440 [Letharia columbiana]